VDFIRLCKLYGLTDSDVHKLYSPDDRDQHSSPSKVRSER